jgi:DNA-directed RNA polymerase subunit RPC12/RpoP
MIYQCAVCQDVFESDWSDEEAVQEFEGAFAGAPVEDSAVVCDNCYNRIMKGE